MNRQTQPQRGIERISERDRKDIGKRSERYRKEIGKISRGYRETFRAIDKQQNGIEEVQKYRLIKHSCWGQKHEASRYGHQGHPTV
jgi:hypothetical protein